MKIFTNINNKVMELNEISILIEDMSDLTKLQQFLIYCQEKIEKNVIDHQHFNDFSNNHDNSSSDLIIAYRVGS